jgi:hypothetical protein
MEAELQTAIAQQPIGFYVETALSDNIEEGFHDETSACYPRLLELCRIVHPEHLYHHYNMAQLGSVFSTVLRLPAAAFEAPVPNLLGPPEHFVALVRVRDRMPVVHTRATPHFPIYWAQYQLNNDGEHDYSFFHGSWWTLVVDHPEDGLYTPEASEAGDQPQTPFE